jgi:hypothetical protein
MDEHHRGELAGGASLNKSVAVYAEFPYSAPMSRRTLWKVWNRYRDVAHFCAAFTSIFDEARRGPPSEIDERMKRGFDEELDVTIRLAAAFQDFATTFCARAKEDPLIDPNTAWLLRGIEANTEFVPPPLSPDLLAAAKQYRAPLNPAYG